MNYLINRSSMQAAGLTNWWPFQFGAGGGYLDVIAGLHGNAVGGLAHGAGPVLGSAPNFDGTNDAINTVAPAASTQNHTTGAYPFSIAAWVVPLFINGSGNQEFARIIVHPVNSFAAPAMMAVGTDNSSPAKFYALLGDGSAGGQASVTGTTTLTFGMAYHVVMTSTSTLMKLFVNGVQEGSTAHTIGRSPSAIALCFGKPIVPVTTTQFMWKGFIGDVRIYNRILDPAQIFAMYNPMTRWELYQLPLLIAGAGAMGAAQLRPILTIICS